MKNYINKKQFEEEKIKILINEVDKEKLGIN